jgi:hypothetical protein
MLSAGAAAGFATLAAVPTAGSAATTVGAWTRASTPNPNAPTANALEAVSCTSASFCMAVGFGSSNGVDLQALEEGWNGTAWSLAGQGAASQSTVLESVSCSSTTFCMAVGTTLATTAQADFGAGDSLTEEWNGSAWTAVPSPDASSDTQADANDLESVSCTSASFCFALGVTGPIDDPQPLAERWDGTEWTVASASATPRAVAGVTCTGASSCLAVGGAVAEQWNGSGWTDISDPAWADNLVELNGVACVSSVSCTAVGVSDLGFSPAIEQWNGQMWTDAPLPSLTDTEVFLTGVSCLGPSCVATGFGSSPVLLTSEDGAWAEAPSGEVGIGLIGVSCAVSSCWVVGTDGGTLAESGTVVTVPDAPSSVSATAGDGSATVSFVTPTDTGSPITEYTISATDLTDPANGGEVAFGPASPVTIAALTDGDEYDFTVTADNDVGAGPPSVPTNVVTPSFPLTAVTPPATHGYWLVGGDGGIFSFGSAEFYGSTGSMHLQRPVVGITPTTDGRGYWLVASDGGIFAFGDAGFAGSVPGIGIAPAGTPGTARKLDAPIVGMVPSSDGGGYFMVGGDGGVFAFGDARFVGSCPGIGGCAGAAVAVMPDATGDGYWLVTATGHVYAFGDAPYEGAPGPQAVPVSAAVRTSDGRGYWILFANGAVSAYGDAVALGSPAGSVAATDPATAIVGTSDGHGYWVVLANGAVIPYGDAPTEGGMADHVLNAPIVAATGW